MSQAPDVLRSIIQDKLSEVESAKVSVPLSQLVSRLDDVEPPRGFEARIREWLQEGKAAVIAECKKASPSKGVIRADYNVQSVARSYEQGGAACLSVLTDQKYFQGELIDLTDARLATSLPALRKDFIIDDYQLYESRVAGADCILLIVAALDHQQIVDLGDSARQLGLDVLIEVHSHEELEVALSYPHGMIGINNRNLRNFETTLQTSLNLRRRVPDNRIVISESGIHERDDVRLLSEARIDAYLVGESLMKSPDPGARLNEIFHQ
ncbi:MAG: indole-3-glycerol phosphate synthase TrpC [Acidiferrobacterales bacterium]|nr:indole-3-glycerol phosphate synthase TrpC [Acidiferrobacterales bacterium]